MKKSILMIAVVSMILLGGCQKQIENALEQETDDKKDVYNQLVDENKLNESGIYVEAAELLKETPAPTPSPDADGSNKTDGSIHVTFARNQSLKIQFFLDKAMTQEIENDCYINPGDCIYATEPKNTTGNENYRFDCYKLYEYENGKRIPLNELDTDKKDKIFTIPIDYAGTDISIVPLGHYEERELTLSDYCMIEGHNKREQNGEWSVNGELTTENHFLTSPVSSCSVSYHYDANKFFFVKSSPDELYQDTIEGEVIFRTVQKDHLLDSYSIEIHPYISTEIKTVDGSKFQYKKNDDDEFSEPTKSVVLNQLKYGDQIIVKTKNNVSVQFSEDTYIENPQQTGNTNEFTYTVFNPYESFIFDPSQYQDQDEHGRIIFMIDNKEITEPTEVYRGTEITYKDDNPNDDYAISGKDNEYTILVSDPETTKQELSEIHYYEKVELEINLPQPKEGGKIEYSYNGIKLEKSQVSVIAGDSLEIQLKPSPGWTCELDDDSLEITITEENDLSKIGNISIDELFHEEDTHKPTLIVNLDKNLGKKLEVTVSVPDCLDEKLVYSKGEFLKSYDSYNLGQISTSKGINLSFDKETIQSGKLIKAELFLDDTLVNTGYIGDISQSINFEIYSNDRESEKIYRKAEIYLCTVSAITHKPVQATNGEVRIICSDSAEELKKGDYVDSERMVKVRIEPSDGYSVVTGKSVTDGVYEKEMKYEDYLSDIDSILKKNPIRKNISVTLVTSDSYGNVVFKVNDTPQSGNVTLHEGDKLVLEYTLTDSSMKIDRGFSLNFSDHQTEKITVDASLDGKTIRRSDYITVIKRK